MTMNRQGSIRNPFGGIEWTHIFGPRSGATCNPITGCEHECQWEMPDGTIVTCYAKTTAERLAKTAAGAAYKEGFEHVSFHPEKLDAIRAEKKPTGIFIDSMSDLFGQAAERPWIDQIIQTIRDCPHHVFFSLTKNPSRFREFSGSWPSNWLVGISAPPTFMFGHRMTLEQQMAWFKRALEFLRESPAQLRWVSFEPLSFAVAELLRAADCPLDWAVIGAGSNGSTYYQPSDDHCLPLLTELQARSVPVFFKGNMDRNHVAAHLGGWREEFPTVLRPADVLL